MHSTLCQNGLHEWNWNGKCIGASSPEGYGDHHCGNNFVSVLQLGPVRHSVFHTLRHRRLWTDRRLQEISKRIDWVRRPVLMIPDGQGIR